MPALWIAHVTVTNPELYAKYAELAGPAIAARGGEFIARGARFVQLRARSVHAMLWRGFRRLKRLLSATIRMPIKRH